MSRHAPGSDAELDALRPAIVAAVVGDALVYLIERTEERARSAEDRLAQVRAAVTQEGSHGR